MINKETIKTLVEEWLQGNDYFLVDIMFGSDDRIVIEIDHADGVWIEDCAALSRFLQERLGDELGDFELEVGSAGIGQPFKVEQQYINHIGDEVEVLDADGKKVVGILKEVNGREFMKEVAEITFENGHHIYADIGSDSNLAAVYDVLAVILYIKDRSNNIERIVRNVYPMPEG